MNKINYLLFFYIPIFLFPLHIVEAQTRAQELRSFNKISSKSVHYFPFYKVAESGVIDSVIYKTIDQYKDLRTHKETFAYNSNSKINFVFDEIWEPESNNWTNYSIDTITYDEDGNIVQELGLLWSDGEWENWWKNEYTYNNKGEKKTWQYYNWLLFSGWSKGVYETYYYDEVGRLILKEAINSGYNVWRDSLVYNEKGMLSIYFAEDWQEDQWINDWRELYTYNENQQVTEVLREIWVDGQWVNDQRESYQYNTENNLISVEQQRWTNGGEWANFSRALYMFSAENNLIFGKHELFDGDNWVQENGLLEFYDKNGNHFYYSRQTEIIVHYNNITDIENNELISESFSLEQNYPNPFNPSTTINYSIPKQTSVTLKVFDLMGSEVATLVNKEQPKGNYEVEFNGSELTSGIYFYRLQAGDYIETKKMILLK